MTVEWGAGTFGQRARRLSRAVPIPAAAVARVERMSRIRWQEHALLVVALVAIVGMRQSLTGFSSADYGTFLSKWFAFLQQNGFAGLGQEFADYNVPYLYLLFVGTLTPLPGLEWVKLLSSLSDIALAAGSFALLGRLGMSRFAAAGAAVLVLLLPEVLLNSAVWGQADSLYTALMVWALYFVVRHRPSTAWALVSLALAFKLQALFVLPAFVLAFVVHRHRVRVLFVAAIVFVATWVPAIIAGRSIGSLLGVYSKQAGQYRELTMMAPSLYAWLPSWGYDWFKRAGILFAIAVCSVLLALLVRRFRSTPLTDRTLLHIAALFGLLVPFLLPSMHERYFYSGDVLLFLLAVTSRRFLLAALAAQVVAEQSYTEFLFAMPPVLSIQLLVLVQLGILTAVIWPLVVTWRNRAMPTTAPIGGMQPPLATTDR